MLLQVFDLLMNGCGLRGLVERQRCVTSLYHCSQLFPQRNKRVEEMLVDPASYQPGGSAERGGSEPVTS